MPTSGFKASVGRRAALGGLAASALASFPAPAIAQAEPTVRWRLTSSFPRSLKGTYAAATTLSQRVSEATDGKFEIRYFAPSEIVGALQALDATQNGTVECCHTASYFYVGRDPSFAFGTAIPFGLNTRQHDTWLHRGGGLALLAEFYAKYNVVHLPFGNTCAQMAGWFRREINVPGDLRGLKMRIPGIAGQVMARLGAVPQSIAPGDVYTALERGTIDAAELSGPYDDEGASLYKVAKYYYYPGWHEVSAATNLFINNDKWQELPKSYKAILTAAAAEASREMVSDYDMGNMLAVRRLAGAGTVFKSFPREVLEALSKASEEVLREISGSNPGFQKIYTEWLKFRKDANLWYSISETPIDIFNQQSTRG
jgi:TRAP-type mannitol/chloroaromatic compound transport system substrate-binding protein